MPKKSKKAKFRVRRQPRQPKKPSKNKQKMIQEVHVNLSSGGGSASTMPSHFMDKTGENVTLQRLSDSVNAFMRRAQEVKNLEPTTPLPVQYNDSPVDDVQATIRSARVNNPILNPRPINNTQPIAEQVIDAVTVEPDIPTAVFEDTEQQTNDVDVIERDKMLRKQSKMAYIEGKMNLLRQRVTALQQFGGINETDARNYLEARYTTKASILNALKRLRERLRQYENLSRVDDINP